MPVEQMLSRIEQVAVHIYEVRGQKVIVAADLAEIYGVTTKRLNEAVKRNIDRFPSDFMFQLTKDEAVTWHRLRSQIATLKRGQHLKYLPNAFTEHGAIMVATVLNSPQAVQTSVFIVRAFVGMRDMLAAHRDLSQKLEKLEQKYDVQFKVVFEAIRKLMTTPEPPRKQIGFHVRERRATYRAGRNGR
jgi:hypothetical protein